MSQTARPAGAPAARRLESTLKRFEHAWRRGLRPAIDDYLPADGPDRHPLLVELAHVALELRLKDGESARVEHYLERYPELTADRDAVADLAVAEFALRRRRQPGLDPAEYHARFPDLFVTPGALPPQDTTSVSPAVGGAVLPVVPGYEVLRELGRGGMGIVFEARQANPARRVALKMVLAGPLAPEEALRRFHTEAAVVASLDHPNVVPVYEVGDSDGLPFFSMKLVEGGSLARRLTGCPRPDVRGLVALLVKAARAVHHAHQRGVLHRDLKPANILLGPDGEPLVSDFGLALRLTGGKRRTTPGQLVGTPCYVAPEQIKGQATPAADVYGLGGILYEMLTGQPPFGGGNTAETLRQVSECDPKPPRACDPGVSPDLEAVCLKCLRKDPCRRYASAEALADDLERWLKGEPVIAAARENVTQA
jgi:serine/threonine-protein kinase